MEALVVLARDQIQDWADRTSKIDLGCTPQRSHDQYLQDSWMDYKSLSFNSTKEGPYYKADEMYILVSIFNQFPTRKARDATVYCSQPRVSGRLRGVHRLRLIL